MKKKYPYRSVGPHLTGRGQSQNTTSRRTWADLERTYMSDLTYYAGGQVTAPFEVRSLETLSVPDGARVQSYPSEVRYHWIPRVLLSNWANGRNFP